MGGLLEIIAGVLRGGTLFKRGCIYQGSGQAEFLEVLSDSDLMHQFLKLCEEIIFTLRVLAWLGVLLLSALEVRGGVVLEADSNRGIQKRLSHLTCLGLICALQISCSPLSYYIPTNDLILYTQIC